MNSRRFTSLFAIGLIAILSFAGQLFGMGAGVLPYKIENGKTYFLVGYNPKKKTVSDFGGMAEFQKDHGNPISTAAREFNEETMFMFSAGTLPIPNLIQTYQHGHFAIPYHRAVMPAVQNFTHRLTKAWQNFNYTMFIVPVWTMPHQAEARDLYAQRDALERSYPNAWSLGAEPNDFAWVSKDDLYKALNTTPVDQPVVVRAPSHRNPGRTFTLFSALAGILRHGTAENGQMGLQAVMP